MVVRLIGNVIIDFISHFFVRVYCETEYTSFFFLIRDKKIAGDADRPMDPCLWEDGTPVTPAQRRLAVRVFSGKLPPHLYNQGGRAVLKAVDQATLHGLMNYVDLPRDPPGRLITTHEGESLLNHRR